MVEVENTEPDMTTTVTLAMTTTSLTAIHEKDPFEGNG